MILPHTEKKRAGKKPHRDQSRPGPPARRGQ
jgi:hypothetical protein